MTHESWTFPPRRILVPVDFGAASARAVSVAAALAERYEAALVALHAAVIEAPAYFTREQAHAIERERHLAGTVAEHEVTQFVRRLTARHVRARFVEESPATAIAEAARAADLIVMGTHGRRGPSRWWLGSVAERTVREASVPVLVVRADPAGVAPRSLFQRPLMIAADATPDEAPAHIAAALAEAFGGALAERAASCEQEVAREREATLLVVPAATAGRRGWFGTSAEKVIRSCTLPMLFVPLKPPAESVNLSREADHDYRAHA